jgi:hypothetical protein
MHRDGRMRLEPNQKNGAGSSCALSCDEGAVSERARTVTPKTVEKTAQTPIRTDGLIGGCLRTLLGLVAIHSAAAGICSRWTDRAEISPSLRRHSESNLTSQPPARHSAIRQQRNARTDTVEVGALVAKRPRFSLSSRLTAHINSISNPVAVPFRTTMNGRIRIRGCALSGLSRWVSW